MFSLVGKTTAIWNWRLNRKNVLTQILILSTLWMIFLLLRLWCPPPRSSKKKPAVVVSPGAARPVAVDRDRSRSRSPKRSPSATLSTSTGSHALPPSLGYVPKPPRSSSGSKGSKPR